MLSFVICLFLSIFIKKSIKTLSPYIMNEHELNVNLIVARLNEIKSETKLVLQTKCFLSIKRLVHFGYLKTKI